ncbi:MAG TPA: hypothetical protein VFG07_06120 [Thermoplasmata archaeon]|nr:hypothetical protein [Thermoplasmata archaeon]
MNRATLRWVLLVPLAVYVLLDVVLLSPAVGLVGLLLGALVALPVLDVASDRPGAWLYIPTVGVAVAFALGLLGDLSQPVVENLLVALIVGAPLFLLGIAWRWKESTAAGFFVYLLLAAVALFELATASTVGAAGVEGGPAAWFGAASATLHSQWSSLTAFGSGGAIPPAPLGAVPNVVLAVTVLLPFFGLMATWLAPPRGKSRPEEETADPTLVDSSAVPLGPLVVAVGAVLAFEAAALVTTPQVAVVGSCIAVTEMVVAVVVASRWGSAPVSPRRTAAEAREPSSVPIPR